jgi:hypothetical protein
MEVNSTVMEFSCAQTDRRSNKFNRRRLKNSQTIDVQFFRLFLSHSVNIYIWKTCIVYEKITYLVSHRYSAALAYSTCKSANRKSLYGIFRCTAKNCGEKSGAISGFVCTLSYLLGAFAKLQKATIIFIKSVRPSVRTHETTRLLPGVM